MNKVSVVTSCSFGGWHEYGFKCLESMLIHWPLEIDIYLVSEDKLPIEQVQKWEKREGRLISRSLYDNAHAKFFYEQHANNAKAKGKGRPTYDFRLDAYRFSKKVFAIELIAAELKVGRLIWLDADTVTLNPVPLEMLQRMPPNGSAIAYLARLDSYHSECGWVAYNLDLEITRQFITQFSGLYHSGEVFKLKEWHDSWVFDWLRKRLNIASHKIPHNNNGHPFVYSELGQYMDHLKGNRKRLGMSTEHPRFKRRKG